MAVTERLNSFGLQGLCFYNRSSGETIGRVLQILGSATVDTGTEMVELTGGCNMGAWNAQKTKFNGMLTVTVKEVTADLLALLFDTTATERTAEAAGDIEDEAGTDDVLTNKTGTSVFKATTGIASVEVLTAANLKTGKYVVKGTDDGTKVDIYCYTDVDFGEGADEAFLDDDNKIAEDIVIATDTAVLVEDDGAAGATYGFTLTGGSGTIAITEDDTAVFYVRKINEGSFKIPIGAKARASQKVGVFINSCRQENGNFDYFEFYKCVVNTPPIPLNEAGFSEIELTIKLLYDSTKAKVGDYKYIIDEA